MDIFSISDLEHLTGIKAHTIRTWEQRYGLLNPGRKKSLHRVYTDEDLKYILRVVFLYKKGIKISKIARLTEEEVKDIAIGNNLTLHESVIYLNRLTESSIDFNEERFEEDLVHAISHLGLEKTMEEIIFPFLKRMGIFWLTGHVLPAQEHFASQIIIRKMISAIEEIPLPISSGARKVLLFTPEGEFHEMPLLYTYYLLRKKGVCCIYLGTDKNIEVLEEVVSKIPVTELFLHVITNLTKTNMRNYLEQLEARFPGLQVYYAGAAVNLIGNIGKDLHCLHSSLEIKQFISSEAHSSVHLQ